MIHIIGIGLPRGFRCIRSSGSRQLEESDAIHSIFFEKRPVTIAAMLFSYILRQLRRERR